MLTTSTRLLTTFHIVVEDNFYPPRSVNQKCCGLGIVVL